MFDERALPGDLDQVRAEHAPRAVVLDTPDFETIPPEQAESLGVLADSLEPVSHDPAWLPSDAPDALREYVSGAFTIGMPGDGGVTWTRQTVPPTVFVKARMDGTPDGFRDFLVAEALVQAGLDLPEHFIGFFRERYRDLASATPLGPADTYQLAFACYEAWVGLHTRAVFASWDERYPRLYEAWRDAGERLEPRLAGLTREVATGQTGFAAAAELACGAVRHGLDLPTPFGPLATEAYRDTGAAYAVVWARKTFERLEE